MALKLRAQWPPAQGGGGAEKKASQQGNAIPPYLGAPASFKRMLGVTADESPSRVGRGPWPRRELGRTHLLRQVAGSGCRCLYQTRQNRPRPRRGSVPKTA